MILRYLCLMSVLVPFHLMFIQLILKSPKAAESIGLSFVLVVRVLCIFGILVISYLGFNGRIFVIIILIIFIAKRSFIGVYCLQLVSLSVLVSFCPSLMQTFNSFRISMFNLKQFFVPWCTTPLPSDNTCVVGNMGLKCSFCKGYDTFQFQL